MYLQLGITFVMGVCAGVGLLIVIQETRQHTVAERKAREAAQAQLRDSRGANRR